jgi:hypothetical protein
MLPVGLVAAVVSEWGAHWYTGGVPRQVELQTNNPITVADWLDAVHQDMVVCHPDIPWTSDGIHEKSKCVHMQVVKSNMSTPVAPSLEFLRGSHFSAFAGNEAFKTFGATATYTESDRQVYYPLAADEDGKNVLVVRAPGTVPPDCATTRCQSDHIKHLSAMMNWAAVHPLVNKSHPADGVPAVKTTMYFVSGNKPLHDHRYTWPIISEVIILALVIAVAAGMIKPPSDTASAIAAIDDELYACAACVLAAAVSITFTSAVYSKEMSDEAGTVVRSVDGTNISVAPPKLQLVLAPAIAWACFGFLIAGVGDKFRGKDIRNSHIHRAMIAFVTTVAVAYAIIFPTSVEGVHGTRVTHDPSQQDVRQSLYATEQLVTATFESQDDAESALHRGVSRVNTMAVLLAMVTVVGAAICCFVAHRRDVALHESRSTIYLVIAGVYGAFTAANQVYADYHELETVVVCVDDKDLRRDNNAYLICAAIGYSGAVVLGVLAVLQKRPHVGALLAQAAVAALALGALLQVTPSYVQTKSPCSTLENMYRAPLLSAMAVSLAVSALIVHAISPCSAISRDDKPLPPYTEADVSRKFDVTPSGAASDSTI